MDDLISRQAAIDAIRKDMYADKDYMSGMICDGIADVLNKLPSVQPEQLQKERDAALDTAYAALKIVQERKNMRGET